MDSTNDLFNTDDAADWLNGAIPNRSPAYWRNQLIINRRADGTQPHLVPFVTIGKLAIYTRAALESYAEFEKRRRNAGVLKPMGRVTDIIEGFGLNSTGGQVTGSGRKLMKYDINKLDEPTPDGGTERIVQIITSKPLRAWHLTSQEAAKLIQDLTEALKSHNHEPAAPVSASDTPESVIHRGSEKKKKK